MALTTTRCKNAKYESGGSNKLADGGGLFLHLMPSGAKVWRQKYRFGGKENTLTHGPYPTVSLLEARERREEARKTLLLGKDPAQVKKDQKITATINAAMTFELVAREWHDLNKDRWSKHYAADVINRLESGIFPHFGNYPIADVSTPQILDAMRRIERRGASEVARRTLQFCGQVFRYGIITGRLVRNPATDLRGALRPSKHEHFASIDTKELPEFLHVLETNDVRLYKQTRLAIRMLMLTFVRTRELIESKWAEFDIPNAQWIIPAERMKMRRPHIVPLSKQAVAAIKELQELNGQREFVFASEARPRQHMSNNTILFALKRLGYQGRMTGHGFRALAMTTIKEKLKYRHEVVDRQLAHAPANKVDAAYDRAAFLEEREKMMQDWADYLDKVAATGKVIHAKFGHKGK